MNSVAIEPFYSNDDNRMKVEWQLSNRCNFNCSYCSEYTHNNKLPYRDLSDYKMVVNKLKKFTEKEIWISITGGEPCIYPELKPLLQYCIDKHINFLSLCTNGSQTTKYYIDLMKYLNNIIFSYHFEYKVDILKSILEVRKCIENTKKTLHVHVMMLPGHFKKAIEVMNQLKQNDILFGIRRIRPLYMSDGSPAKPYQKGGKLRLTKNGPDYSKEQGYYSSEELNFFEGDIHDYI